MSTVVACENVAKESAAERLLTLDEFLELCRLPEYEDKQLELDEGRLIVMPPAGDRHGTECALVVAMLMKYAESSGIGRVVCNDPGLLLSREPDVVRAPDVAYYRESVALEEVSAGLPTRLPELVVEVLSPWDKPNAVLRKVQQYLRAGVQMVWVVDAEDKTVAVYRAGREPQVLVEKDELSGEEVLPGFSCRVADLFRLPGVRGPGESGVAARTSVGEGGLASAAEVQAGSSPGSSEKDEAGDMQEGGVGLAGAQGGVESEGNR